jgi:hypothetical protein
MRQKLPSRHPPHRVVTGQSKVDHDDPSSVREGAEIAAAAETRVIRRAWSGAGQDVVPGLGEPRLNPLADPAQGLDDQNGPLLCAHFVEIPTLVAHTC